MRTTGGDAAPEPDRALLTDLPGLVARARALMASEHRVLLGVTGAPGAGKSTFAHAFADTLGATAVVVPMDGFHLAQRVLDRLGRSDRKGAPDTFDAPGFVALVARLRADDGTTVWVPEFRREIEEPIAGAIGVDPARRFVIVEGNYLLLRSGEWAGLDGLFDAVWFVAPDESTRHERLVARHLAFGRDPKAARDFALGSDERNAQLIAATRASADLVLN